MFDERRKMASRPRLVNRADQLAVACIAAAGAGRIWLVTLGPGPSALPVAAAVLTMPTVWTIKHNALHGRVFARSTHDRWFHRVLTALTGSSTANTTLVHNAIHHRYNNGPDDWTAVSLARPHRWRLLRLITYPAAVLRGLPGARKVYLRNRPALRRRINREQAVVLAGVVVPLVWSPSRGFWYVVVPMVFGQWFLIAMNYLQHAEGHHPPTSDRADLDHSVNHIGRLFNRVLFNVGYHTAHHLEPSAHWSELPEIHRREVAGRVDPRLERRSFWGHLVSGYVLRVDRPT